MSFTTALYYPWIDIRDEKWLMSAILYWESIRTIVPESIKRPYSTRTAEELQEAGVLTPLRVNSSMDEVESLSEDIVKYLNTSETAELFMSNRLYPRANIHTNKIPISLQELSRIHPDKLPNIIRRKIDNPNLLDNRDGEWFYVDYRFADYYMTLLATHLSDRIGAGLLTDTSANNTLAVSAKLDSNLSGVIAERQQQENVANGYRSIVPSTLAQGMLVNLIIEKINIAPNTSIPKLLKFREDNVLALGRFRSEIGTLTQAISSDLPAEHLQQAISDIYINNVSPAIGALKEGLSALGIKWFVDDYINIVFLDTSITSMMYILGLSVPQALLAGAGISLTSSVIRYNLEKRQTLRNNPFTYVMAAKRAFS